MSDVSAGPAERNSTDGFRATGMSASLTVTDIERSLHWYSNVVGFAVEQRHEADGRLVSVALEAGSVRIRINQDDGAKGSNRPRGVGFSLYFATAQDVDRLAEGIKERGGTLTTEPADMPWGARVFRLTDPDGFGLAIAAGGNTD